MLPKPVDPHLSLDSSIESHRPHWLVEPCPVWCDNLHEESDFVEDRSHMSEWVCHVVLSTEEPVVIDRQPDDTWSFPCELMIYLDQHIGEVMPLVIVEEAHVGRKKLRLTPMEARQLGEALIRGSMTASENTAEAPCHLERWCRASTLIWHCR
jgi:hypothetical protein